MPILIAVAGQMGSLIDLGGVIGPIPEARVRAHPKLMDCKEGWEFLQREIRICLLKEEESGC